MSAFVVLKAGVLSTLQDQGRFGYAHLGLSQGGPADYASYRIADLLLQNQSPSCQIEVSVGGLSVLALTDTVFCVTGAAMPLTVNGQPKSLWHSHRIKKDDVIELGFAKSGLRCYLAVAGGFKLPKDFGSNSTVLREKVGGIAGAALQQGQFLPVRSTYRPLLWVLPQKLWPDFSTPLQLGLVPGYQQHWFDEAQWQQLCGTDYQVSALYDRMGYRLQGEPLLYQSQALLSEGISYGAVQLPPDGLPIVLLNDRQTLGGYPKPGAILARHAAALAQCTQGHSIRFYRIESEQLAAYQQEQQRYWAELPMDFRSLR
ncbi:5-oxoprolinase subunit C family protein [Rheinheimera mangrovi]|uniref:5-oxoprolinase subunit C family protein n=1 Tax=Rheinheimera mangrovi TaxID=2498451 RepID=UPI000F8DFD38|nr:biotin-dependent carboxyltransferase family protein [Rheinheimera mangrovi]